MKKAAVLVIVLAVVAAGLPALLGALAQGRINELTVAASDNPIVRVSVDGYERGWRRSRALLSVGLQETYRSILQRSVARDAEQQPQSAEFADILERDIGLILDVAHGPLMPRGGIGLADLTLRTDPTTEGLDELLAALQMPVLGEVEVRIGFGSESSVRWAVPPVAFSGPGTTLVTSELTGEGTYDAASQRQTGQGRMDRLELTTAAAGLTVENLAISADVVGGISDIRPGSSIVSVERLAVDIPRNDSTIAVENLEASGQSEVSDGGELLHSISALTADLVSGFVNGREQVVTDFRFDATVSNLDLAAVNAYQDWAFEVAGGIDPSAFVAELQPIVYRVLTAEPEFEIGPLAFHWNDGRLQARVQLHIDDEMLPAEPMFSFMDTGLWARVVSMEADLDVDRNIAEWVAMEVISAQVAKSTDMPGGIADGILEAQARGTLISLVAQGMLEETESGYRFRGSYENGIVEVNGQVVPIGAGQQGIF